MDHKRRAAAVVNAYDRGGIRRRFAVARAGFAARYCQK